MENEPPHFPPYRDVTMQIEQIEQIELQIKLSAAFAFVPFGWHTLAQQTIAPFKAEGA